MTDSPLYPLKFHPVYKDYLWGGSRVPARFNRDEPPGVYAESWEISDHPDGMSRVSNGPLAGRTLAELIPLFGPHLLGTRCAPNRFPLLIKLIDAAQPLSLQVHPDHTNAESVGGEAKTEMWYFLDETPEAAVWCGFKQPVSREEFLQALQEKKLTRLLRHIPARRDSAVFVPGGRLHAIDAGCLILEIQQSSNTTFRVYDWDRTGPDGQPRPLHLEQALQVIRFDDDADPVTKPKPFEEAGFQALQMCCSDWFRLDRFELDRPFPVRPDGLTFQALFIAAGHGRLGNEPVETGTSLLIPAGMDETTLIPEGGPLCLLRTTLP